MPVVTPLRANSKVDTNKFLKDFEDSFAKLEGKQRVFRVFCIALRAETLG